MIWNSLPIPAHSAVIYNLHVHYDIPNVNIWNKRVEYSEVSICNYSLTSLQLHTPTEMTNCFVSLTEFAASSQWD